MRWEHELGEVIPSTESRGTIIRHSEIVVLRSHPRRFLTRNSIFTLSRTAGLLALLAVVVVLVAVLAGCARHSDGRWHHLGVSLPHPADPDENDIRRASVSVTAT
jgi:hypothetical protein